MNSTTPVSVVFFGIQGSGKGTQARLLQSFLERNSDLPTEYFEMGERLRGFSTAPGQASKKVGGILDQGGLLPAFIPSHIMTSFFLQEFSGEENLIVDGAARRLEQSQVLDDALAFYGRTDYHTIVLELSDEEAVARMKVRGRHDDDDEKIQRRIGWYKTETLPAIKELEDRGRAVHYIDGAPSVEEVHKAVLNALGLE